MSCAREGPSRALAAAVVFAAALLAFSFGASQREIWRTDEQRYVEVAREMSLPDASRIVPRLDGAPYVHKPPGFFWSTLALHRAVGLDLESAAKGVSAVSGALTVALVFLLGSVLGSSSVGLAAAFVLASTQVFLSLALRANLDALLTFFVTSTLFGFARAEGLGSGNRSFAAGFRLLAGASAGLGLLVKGPVALAIPASVVVGFLLFGGKRIRMRPWLGAGAALLLPGMVWLALAAVAVGPGYVNDLVVGHGVAHPLGMVSKLRPPWFYLRQLPWGLAPWSLLLPAAFLLAWRGRRRSDGADAFVLAWAFAPLLLLSAFPAKRHLYLLPIYPGTALLIGRWLAWRRAETQLPAGWLRSCSLGGSRLTGALVVTILALAGGLFAAVALAPDAGVFADWDLAGLEALATGRSLAAALVGSVVLAAAGLALIGSSSGRTAWRGSLGLALGTIALLVGVVHPIQSAGREISAFYGAVAELVGEDAVAVMPGVDFAPERLLQEAFITRVERPADALSIATADPAATRVWLIAEEAQLAPFGRSADFETVLRHDPPLGRTLLLLRRGI